jgi:hypothetical protein
MIRTIIACGIVPPMASPSIPAPDEKAGPAFSLLTVIAELQFIFQFASEDRKNPRVAGLLEQAQLDLALVASKIIHGDDPLVGSDPSGNSNPPPKD